MGPISVCACGWPNQLNHFFVNKIMVKLMEDNRSNNSQTLEVFLPRNAFFRRFRLTLSSFPTETTTFQSFFFEKPKKKNQSSA